MKTNLPGFSAGLPFFEKGNNYFSEIIHEKANNIITQLRSGGPGLTFGVIGSRTGSVGLGFHCDMESCRCDGLADCVDLAGTGICHHFSCYIGWVTGELVCTCER